MIDSRGVRRAIGFLVAVIVVAIAIGFVFLPASSASAGNFVFYGRGDGHAVGFSQWGAWGGAREGHTYDEILAFYYPRTTLQTVSPSQEILTVRISSNPYGSDPNPGFTTVDMKPAVSTATLRKTASGDVVTTEDVAVDVRVRTVSSGGGVKVTVGTGAQQGPYTKVELVPGGEGAAEGRVIVPTIQASNHGEFWGTILVRPASSTYLLIENVVQVDHYAAGVGEVISDWAQLGMPEWYALEAVKAEAVAARSYALKKDAGGTLYDNAKDICYWGYTFEHKYPGLTQAAEETAGKILTHGDAPIWAYSSAHSGGYTTAVGYNAPYLVAQPDPWSLAAPTTHPSYPGPGWPWSYTISDTSLSAKINDFKLKDVYGNWVNVGTPMRITVASHETSDPASRPKTLSLIGSGGTATVKMNDFRDRLNKAAVGTPMPSTLVYNITSPHVTSIPCTTIRGTDRYDTAIKISQAMYAGALPADSGLVLAPGETFQEALCGAPLAAAFGGPVLLTYKAALANNVRAEIQRLAPEYVICIGMSSDVLYAVEAAVPSATVTSITGAGGSVYDMSYKVAEALDFATGGLGDAVALITRGDVFPDAIGISPLACFQGWPILLTDSAAGALNASAAAALADLGITQAVKVGTYAPLPDGVAGLANLSGGDRYQTNRNVAVWAKANAGLNYDHLGIATGDKFPDALAAGPYMALGHGILLLSPLNGPLPASIAAEISANAAAVDKVTFIAMIEPVISSVQGLLP